MIFKIVAKLLAISICSVAVNGLDGISNEHVNEDRVSRLSNNIENLRNLLDRSPRYNNKYRRQSLVPNIYNRETNYDIYLKQYYIEPILNSLSLISEQVNTITATNNNPRPIYGQLPGQFANSYGSVSGAVQDWGEFRPSFSQSHSFLEDSSPIPSFPLNENTNSNGTAAPEPSGIVDRFPQPLFVRPSYQASGVQFSSKVPSDTQTNKFNNDYGSSLPTVRNKFGFGGLTSNQKYYGEIPSYTGAHNIVGGSQSAYIANRYPDVEDTEVNWGLVNDSDDDDDYIRPISLKSKTSAPSNCNCNMKNAKSPPIQLPRTFPKTPLTCKAAVLSCCAPGIIEQDRRDCFASQGCVRSYDTGLACLPVVVRAVYKELYANL